MDTELSHVALLPVLEVDPWFNVMLEGDLWDLDVAIPQPCSEEMVRQWQAACDAERTWRIESERELNAWLTRRRMVSFWPEDTEAEVVNNMVADMQWRERQWRLRMREQGYGIKDELQVCIDEVSHERAVKYAAEELSKLYVRQLPEFSADTIQYLRRNVRNFLLVQVAEYCKEGIGWFALEPQCAHLRRLCQSYDVTAETVAFELATLFESDPQVHGQVVQALGLDVDIYIVSATGQLIG